jgi:hypothetical protein
MIYNIPFKIPGSQSDRQSFHYFCVQGAPDLSGYSTSNFWTHNVLQYSQHEPLVRRALIALSSIHREYAETSYPVSECRDFNPLVIQEYNKAVRQLRKYMAATTNPSKILILTCCVLFYCFENARGDYEAAMGHLHAGLSILQDWIAEKGGNSFSTVEPNSAGDLHSLTQLLARLDMQVTLFTDDRLPYLCLVSSDETSGKISCVPREFNELIEAQESLDKLQNWLSRFLILNSPYKFEPLGDVPTVIVNEKKVLESQFTRWSTAMATFIETRLAGHKSEESRIKVLVMVHRIMLVLLRDSLTTNGSTSNKSNTEYDEIVTLAESVLGDTEASGRRGRGTFSVESGVIGPLYLLLAKCRDHQLRSRAVSLLAASPRREGLIEGKVVVNIVERLMKLNRQSSPPFGPEDGALEDCAASAGIINASPDLFAMCRTLGIRP